MKFEIKRKHLRGMLNFAATKDIRYYLFGLHVLQDARGTILQATDGHVIGRLLLNSDPKPLAEVIIGSADIKRLLGTKKQGDDLVQFDVVDGGEITINTIGLFIKIQAVEGKFPNCDRVTPAKLDDIAPAHFNPEFPMKFALAGEAFTGKKQQPIIYQQGENASIVTLECEPAFLGVMMPMRTSFVACAVPAWANVAS